MKPLLLFTGPVVTRSGYGAHSRDLVRSLIKMDKFEIHINSLRWGNTPWNALNLQNEEDKLIFQFIPINEGLIHFDLKIFLFDPKKAS